MKKYGITDGQPSCIEKAPQKALLISDLISSCYIQNHGLKTG
ncbi:hypothetical protein ENTCAN_08793 [Enterobacter cancerogenus ATCC 35316]|nr:hypothetical protein ENTCAN_08793 [Enterobacter cancerogenus ATCC 35316]